MDIHFHNTEEKFKQLIESQAVQSATEPEAADLTLKLCLQILRRFWVFVRPYRGQFYLGLCLVLIHVRMLTRPDPARKGRRSRATGRGGDERPRLRDRHLG